LWGRLGVAGEEETIRKREGVGLELRQPGNVKIAIQLHRPYPSDRVDIKMAVEMLFMVVVREGDGRGGLGGVPESDPFLSGRKAIVLLPRQRHRRGQTIEPEKIR
jgi:hypothetical protein